MENSGVSSIVLKRRIFGVGDPSPRIDGTFSDRTNYQKMRCAFGIENDSAMMLHRQQLVLQAPAATCSVDSTSQESFTETLSDRSITCDSDYNNSAICARDCEFTTGESQINTSRPIGNALLEARPTKPRRFEKWILKTKMERKTKEKRRRLRQ